MLDGTQSRPRNPVWVGAVSRHDDVNTDYSFTALVCLVVERGTCHTLNGPSVSQSNARSCNNLHTHTSTRPLSQWRPHPHHPLLPRLIQRLSNTIWRLHTFTTHHIRPPQDQRHHHATPSRNCLPWSLPALSRLHGGFAPGPVHGA